jgi:hypothetical protein
MEKSIIENVVNGFKKAATELEELQLQLALGKSEAKDKFESLKKRFNGVVHDAELKADKAKEWAEDMRTKFDELRVQLALGKAETKDAFEVQRKKINAKIHEIENYILTHPQPNQMILSKKEERKWLQSLKVFKMVWKNIKALRSQADKNILEMKSNKLFTI